MKVLIYGGGAVGLGLASCLLSSQHTVDILARKSTVGALRKDGLKRMGIFGDYVASSKDFQSYSSLNEITAQDYDFILVCTKSFDTHNAGEDISSHNQLLGPNTKIVHFQNGWGNAQKLLHFFPEEKIYTARVITGFMRPSLNLVTITVHAQPIHIGSLFGKDLAAIKPLVEAINQGGIPCKISDAVDRDLWAKMLYNCALNPLGAILNVNYGALGDNENTKDIMNHIFDEIFDVLGKSVYATHWSTAQDYQEIFYRDLLPATYDHESSMVQDIRRHKRIEIDALNGAVVQLGQENGVNVPYNKFLLDMLKFIEQKNWQATI